MLEQVLTLVIPTTGTRDMNHSDLRQLIGTYAITEQARDDFLACKITFDEYMDLLETAQVNIDSYLESVEHNLEVLQLV